MEPFNYVGMQISTSEGNDGKVINQIEHNGKLSIGVELVSGDIKYFNQYSSGKFGSRPRWGGKTEWLAFHVSPTFVAVDGMRLVFYNDHGKIKKIVDNTGK